MIHAAFNFILKIYTTRQQALLAFFLNYFCNNRPKPTNAQLKMSIFTLKISIIYYILNSRVGVFSSEDRYSHCVCIMTYVHTILEKEKKKTN